MLKRKKFSDIRFNGICCYCGQEPSTQDHVPSKILLDRPYPTDLHSVDCCRDCNQGFSMDEAYFACFLECVIHGTTEVEKLTRSKIKETLTKTPLLHRKLSEALVVQDSKTYFKIDGRAIENVLLKLAKGHLAYETSEPKLDKPTHFVYKPITTMSEDERYRFFAAPEITTYPEVGSRLFEQVVVHQDGSLNYHWVVVQEGRYEYLVDSQLSQLGVRLIIQDYLAVEALWVG